MPKKITRKNHEDMRDRILNTRDLKSLFMRQRCRIHIKNRRAKQVAKVEYNLLPHRPPTISISLTMNDSRIMRNISVFLSTKRCLGKCCRILAIFVKTILLICPCLSIWQDSPLCPVDLYNFHHAFTEIKKRHYCFLSSWKNPKGNKLILLCYGK